MEFENEDQLKRELGIESWRNLSKDKFVSFVSELPNMSKEVALKVVEQFPDFKTLVMGSLSQVHEQATKAVDASWKSQKKVHKAYDHYRHLLERELGRDDLTPERRIEVLGLFKKAVDDESLKDSEFKNHVFRVLAVVGTVALGTAAAGAAVLGVRGKIDT